VDQLDARQHDRNDHDFKAERDPPRQVSGDEPAEQRAHRSSDRSRSPNHGVHPLLRGALEVAVDQRLHGGQQQRRAEPTHDGPEDDDRGHALGERHGCGAHGVAEQT
jgi:hypothetical protein